MKHRSVAKQIASPDYLLGGRVEIGLGTGWQREEYIAGGVPINAARVGRRYRPIGVLSNRSHMRLLSRQSSVLT